MSMLACILKTQNQRSWQTQRAKRWKRRRPPRQWQQLMRKRILASTCKNLGQPPHHAQRDKCPYPPVTQIVLRTESPLRSETRTQPTRELRHGINLEPPAPNLPSLIGAAVPPTHTVPRQIQALTQAERPLSHPGPRKCSAQLGSIARQWHTHSRARQSSE